MEQEEKKEMVRFSGYTEKAIIEAVKEEAKRANRKPNWMIGELLSSAIKERRRLREKAERRSGKPAKDE